MTSPEIRLGVLILQDLQRTSNAAFGESRSVFVNANQETFGVPLPTIRKLVIKHLKAYESAVKRLYWKKRRCISSNNRFLIVKLQVSRF